MRYVIVLLMLSLVGCSASNYTEFRKAIGADPNAWCGKIQIGTIYGTTTDFWGKGSPSTNVTVTSDGCSIRGANVTDVTVPTTSVTVAPPKP